MTETITRKLGFYSIEAYRLGDSETPINNPIEIIGDFLNNLNSLNKVDKIYDLKNEMICYFDTFEAIPNKIYTYKVIFYKAKINHRPNLIDKNTAEERENPKTQTEAEANPTHIVFKFIPESSDIFMIIEEHQLGIGVGQFVNYMNSFLRSARSGDNSYNIKLQYSALTKEDFFAQLDSLRDVKMAELKITKQQFGSSFAEFAGFLSEEVKDELVISIKSNKQQSIKEKIKEQFPTITRLMGESKLKGVKVIGHDSENNSVPLIYDRLIKNKYVNNILRNENTGIVVSRDIFSKMLIELENFTS